MKRKRFGIILLIFIVVLAALFFFMRQRKQIAIENHQPGSIETQTEEHSTQQTDPDLSARDVTTVQLTNEDWKTIVLHALDCDDMEAEITFPSEDEMTISGNLPKSTISSWLNAADEDSQGMYRSILSILPSSLSTSLTCKMECKNGTVQISGTSMSVSGIDIPVDVLDSVWSSVNQGINTSIQEKTNSTNPIQSIYAEDDAIILKQ